MDTAKHQPKDPPKRVKIPVFWDEVQAASDDCCLPAESIRRILGGWETVG